jgi:hypothetical protein
MTNWIEELLKIEKIFFSQNKNIYINNDNFKCYNYDNFVKDEYIKESKPIYDFYYSNQIYDECITIVYQEPLMIAFVKKLDKNIVNLAIKLNAGVLCLIPIEYHTFELYKEAINKYPVMLFYIKIKLTSDEYFELCKIAQNQQILSFVNFCNILDIVNENFNEQNKIIIRQDISSSDYYKICKYIISNNLRLFKFILHDKLTKNDYLDLVKNVINIQPSLLQYIKKEYQTNEILDICLKNNYKKYIKNVNFIMKHNIFPIVEKEIDECIICHQIKDYYFNYECNNRHVCCIECVCPTCYYNCDKNITNIKLWKNINCSSIDFFNI